MVAWNMGEWHAFEELKRFHLPYRTTLLSTFLLTVVFDITVAVEVGLMLSCLFFIWRISTLTRVESLPLPFESAASWTSEGNKIAGLWRIEGALFFGSIDKIEVLLDPSEPLPKLVLLDLTRLLYMDATGQEALDNLRRSIQRTGGRLVVIAASGSALDLMKRSGFLDRLGPAGHAATVGNALRDSTV
jgi:SulP family sulfate permease